jgi:hypothetical protein
LPDGLSGIFFSQGLDRFLLICPTGQFVAAMPQHRHCERSEAIHSAARGEMDCFVAALLAMTGNDIGELRPPTLEWRVAPCDIGKLTAPGGGSGGYQ